MSEGERKRRGREDVSYRDAPASKSKVTEPHLEVVLLVILEETLAVLLVLAEGIHVTNLPDKKTNNYFLTLL